MEVITLKEYMEYFPKKEDIKDIGNDRKCSICNSIDHHSQMLFLMGEKRKGYGHVSTNLCKKCVPRWKEIFNQHRLISTPEEWNWSTWNVMKPFPHHEGDRILLHLGKDGELYLQINYNPSKRQKQIIIEEIR